MLFFLRTGTRRAGKGSGVLLFGKGLNEAERRRRGILGIARAGDRFVHRLADEFRIFALFDKHLGRLPHAGFVRCGIAPLPKPSHGRDLAGEMDREAGEGDMSPERPELAADDPEEEGGHGGVEEEGAIAGGCGQCLRPIRDAKPEEDRDDEPGEMEYLVEDLPSKPAEEEASEPPNAEREPNADDADTEHFVKHVARTFVHVEVFDSCSVSCSVHSGRQGARAN